MKIFIEDIADKLEELNEDWIAFLKNSTGEIVDVGVQYYGIAEELYEDDEIPSHLADWEKDFVQTALGVVNNFGDYAELPRHFDIHEYSIIEDFAESIADYKKRAILYQAIEDKGAFWRFKDKLYELGLSELWFAYKYESLCRIAIRWCDEREISYRFKEEKRGGLHVDEKRNDAN